MKLPFPQTSKYLPGLADWVSTHRSKIDAGHKMHITLDERTGFVSKAAQITIDSDVDIFGTNWRWAPNTFPSPLKGLAKAISQAGIVGTFAAIYHDGRITIQKVEPRR